ncbi:TPA: hypothetical protein EYG96_02495 [Candidatus Gracilibacteria bacterium]|nr:hypothetical protein [Candidatus Gracilibacteria bacterium]HIQ57553.1 hypothetical protein [Candidatus Gracilibacteria bacterium]
MHKNSVNMQSTIQNIVFCCIFFVSLIFTASVHASSKSNITTLEFQYCELETCKKIDNSIFTKKFTIGETIPMRVVIKNPENAPVFSVQSWVKYNSSVFSIAGLSDTESAFDLAAPGEFKAINSKGEMRIGRATTGSAVTDNIIIIADFSVEIKKNPNLATFKFMDFKNSEIGKTAVITIQNNIPVNILDTNPKNLVFKNLKSAAINPTATAKASIEVETGQNNNYENTTVSIESGNINVNAYGSNISTSVEGDAQTVTSVARPTGFRTRTFENGTIEMIWELNEDISVKGYYLYYSTTSGVYMHRRDMGKTNMYKFDKNFFTKDRKIFFAVQAYAENGTVSDFSDETFVITGNEGASSHPFFEQIFPNAQKVGENAKKSKAYYLKEGEINSANFSTIQKPVQKNKVITGNRNIQSGLNLNILLVLMGGFMCMGSGLYIVFGRKEI